MGLRPLFLSFARALDLEKGRKIFSRTIRPFKSKEAILILVNSALMARAGERQTRLVEVGVTYKWIRLDFHGDENSNRRDFVV